MAYVKQNPTARIAKDFFQVIDDLGAIIYANVRFAWSKDEDVIQAGTPIGTAFFNHIEDGIFNAAADADKANADIVTATIESDIIKAAKDTDLTYTGINLTNVKEYHPDGITVANDITLSYTDGDLTSVITLVYDASGVLKKTITEILSYTDGNLTSVERTVA